MAVPWGHFEGLLLAAAQAVQVEMVVATRCHQLQVVAHGEAVLDLDLGQAVHARAGQLADELLAFGQ
ncbi:hypothetical protein D3C80_1798620 [compost metagenome]